MKSFCITKDYSSLRVVDPECFLQKPNKKYVVTQNKMQLIEKCFFIVTACNLLFFFFLIKKEAKNLPAGRQDQGRRMYMPFVP